MKFRFAAVLLATQVFTLASPALAHEHDGDASFRDRMHESVSDRWSVQQQRGGDRGHDGSQRGERQGWHDEHWSQAPWSTSRPRHNDDWRDLFDRHGDHRGQDWPGEWCASPVPEPAAAGLMAAGLAALAFVRRRRGGFNASIR
jgi:hypothetical protein